MSSKGGGYFVYATGVLLMIASTIAGKALQPELTEIGLDEYLRVRGRAQVSAFFLFVFSFPLGVVVCLLGTMLVGSADRARIGLFGLLAIPAGAIVVLVPAVFGTRPSPTYFGLGGTTMAVFIALAVWYWGKYRAARPAHQRAGIDLQAIGYLCFALAAWNTCGFGGMPSLAVFPEKMMALGTRDFAVGQLKSVMALMVLGWIFTALGFRKAERSLGEGRSRESTRSDEPEETIAVIGGRGPG